MISEEKKIKDNKLIQELSLDELDEVNGGRVSATGYTLLFAAVRLIKKKGMDKNYAISEITAGWNQDCDFKKKFTDGTEGDLEDVVQFIDRVWDIIIV